MSTQEEVLDIIAAIIPTMGTAISYTHYKGNIDINNGTLLDGNYDGIAQVALVTFNGTNEDEYTQELRNGITLRLQVYYRIPTDNKIEGLFWEYQKYYARIKKDIQQALWSPNVAGIPQTCRMEELRYIADDYLDGFEKQDKYGLGVYFDFSVVYTMDEGE